MLWIKVIKEIEILLGKNICVCPENKYYNATALSIEGIMNGIENLAVSFTGFGKDSEFAALEEVLFAVKIFVYPQLKIDFTTLPAFVKRFIKLTGLSLAEGKQILGKSVFKLESSINENSLGKNQRLNELYDNALIELQSKLSVGKHSGRKSVIQKLKELGIDVKVDEMGKILSFIRSKSIELKRDLYDNEIIEAISQVH